MPDQLIEVETMARRVAACFGVEEWEDEIMNHGLMNVRVFATDIAPNCRVQVRLRKRPCEAIAFHIGHLYMDYTHILCWHSHRNDRWQLIKHSPYDELMARGLYRLGFPDAEVLSQLPELSSHEKLELRLSLPREFWPAQWLEEAANMPAVDIS